LGILARTAEAGDLRTALTAVREARGTVELVAKLTAGLGDRSEAAEHVNPSAELTSDELRGLVRLGEEIHIRLGKGPFPSMVVGSAVDS
jgi:hypothetical protein